MSPDENQKWHWKEGNAFALEGLKTLLLLNGGAAVALLAFVGNLKSNGEKAPAIGSALFLFGLGALCVALAFALAYLAQLKYGNEGVDPINVYHHSTYVFVFLSGVAFAAGLIVGWCKLAI